MLIELAAMLALATIPVPPTRLTPVDYPAKGGQPLIYDGPGAVTWLQQVKLDPEGRETFDTIFVGQGYFGAWAMSDDGGYGYASGAGSIEGARDIALAQCDSTNPGGCTIVAELLPTGYFPAGPQDFTLSEAMAREFNTGGRADFRAMAISEDGAYAVVWGYATQAEADAAAMADCQTGLLVLNLPDLRAMPCIRLPGY
jgi:hypothetical protein